MEITNSKGKNKKKFYNRLGTVVVGDEKIKMQIKKYENKKIRNILTINERSRVCERNSGLIE